jgi:hypothetical protein
LCCRCMQVQRESGDERQAESVPTSLHFTFTQEFIPSVPLDALP